MPTQREDIYQPGHWIQHHGDSLVPPPRSYRPLVLNSYQHGEQTTDDGINFECAEFAFLLPATLRKFDVELEQSITSQNASA